MIEDLTRELLERAWERVAENAGGPGVDGVTVERYAHMAETGLPELLAHAQSGTYRALPLRQIVVQKKPGSPDTRTLMVPAVRDRILQTAVARVLSRSFEEEFLESSYAYRASRGVDRAVARIVQLRDLGYRHAVDADITAYFDNVSHKLLWENLQERPEIDEPMGALLQQWIRPAVWDGHEVRAVKRGIPQGSPLSPLLANLFLTPLDVALSSGGHKLIRYADDFLILCQGAEEAAAALAATEAALIPLGLRLKPEKTRLTSFAEGFAFLGVRFRENDVMIPWKWRPKEARAVAVARAMPAKLLRAYRDVAPAGTDDVEQPAKPRGKRTAPDTADTVEGEMAYLYVTQTGAVVRKSGDRFLVEHDGEIVLDVPYHRLEHILLFGNVQVTSAAMTEALDHNIALSLFTRQGRFRGSLSPPPGKNVLLRLRQYALHQDEAAALGAAREAIRWKLENAVTVLENYDERNTLAGDGEREVKAWVDGMVDAQGAIDGCAGPAELLGFEGAAARQYFQALARFNRSAFPWEGRRKHPAPDPLNALLSLAYTLLTQELAALVEAHGLDPAIGFFHEIDGARPSLALDLLEPFRAPVADRFVWTLVNRQQVGPGDFSQRPNQVGVFLSPEALRRFFEAYERWMATPVGRKNEESFWTYRSLLRREVAAFAEYLRQDGGQWSPYAEAVTRSEGVRKGGGDAGAGDV